MTRTTGGMSFRKAAVDISADNSDWTELDGVGAAVLVTGGARKTDEQNVFADDIPILGEGGRESVLVQVRFVYSEASTEGFEMARAIHETAGGPCYLRFSPGGDSTADGASPFRFCTSVGNTQQDAGIMTDFVYPQGEAADGAVVMAGFSVRSPVLWKTVVA